jgi:hypothetical protein
LTARKLSNATLPYWCSPDGKIIYKLRHNLLLQPTRSCVGVALDAARRAK